MPGVKIIFNLFWMEHYFKNSITKVWTWVHNFNICKSNDCLWKSYFYTFYTKWYLVWGKEHVMVVKTWCMALVDNLFKHSWTTILQRILVVGKMWIHTVNSHFAQNKAKKRKKKKLIRQLGGARGPKSISLVL